MMLHKFFEEGDWFAAKKFGYGAGMPIAWQGWVLLGGYIVLMAGLALAAGSASFAVKVGGFLGMIAATVLVILISKKRTKGGWHWRP